MENSKVSALSLSSIRAKREKEKEKYYLFFDEKKQRFGIHPTETINGIHFNLGKYDKYEMNILLTVFAGGLKFKKMNGENIFYCIKEILNSIRIDTILDENKCDHIFFDGDIHEGGSSECNDTAVYQCSKCGFIEAVPDFNNDIEIFEKKK